MSTIKTTPGYINRGYGMVKESLARYAFEDQGLSSGFIGLY